MFDKYQKKYLKKYKIQYDEIEYKDTVKYGGMWTTCTESVLYNEQCINRICENDCAYCTIQTFGIYDLITLFSQTDLSLGIYADDYAELVNRWLLDKGYNENIKCIVKPIANDDFQPANLAKWIRDKVRYNPGLNNYYIPITLGWADRDTGHFVMLGTEDGKAVIIEPQTGESRNGSWSCPIKYIWDQSSMNFIDRHNNPYFRSRGKLRYIEYITIVDETHDNQELKVIRIDHDQFYLTSIDGTIRLYNGTSGATEELRFSLIYSYFDKLFTYQQFSEVFNDSNVNEKWENALPEYRYSTVQGYGDKLYSWVEFESHWGDQAQEQWDKARQIHPTDSKLDGSKQYTLLEFMQYYGQKNGIKCWNGEDCNIGDPQLELRYSTIPQYSGKLYSYQDFTSAWREEATHQWDIAAKNSTLK